MFFYYFFHDVNIRKINGGDKLPQLNYLDSATDAFL